MSALDVRLRAALSSREKRRILRKIPDVVLGSSKNADFYTNDYLSLSTDPRLRSRFLERIKDAQNISGSGGSRLLVNTQQHAALESRLASFFNSTPGGALLFNSGFDANVGFFSCIPGERDVVIFDEYIHASVHDGMRMSRAKGNLYAFKHNSITALEELLITLCEQRSELRDGKASVFIAVEALYSMDGDFAPLEDIVHAVERLLPSGNGHIVVDEAHSTGLYGENGEGLVSSLGLESKITARLHTFGKALACNGAILLTSPLIRSYLVNYARSLIYTTALGHAALASIEASFDLLEDGTADVLSSKLSILRSRFILALSPHLKSIPTHIIALPPSVLSPQSRPSPIIPVMTSKARLLAAHLNAQGLNIRPIVYPTVPKGLDRVRVCLHAGNTVEEVARLAEEMVAWARQDTEMSREVPDEEKAVVSSVTAEGFSPPQLSFVGAKL